jgi:tRNA pseudouridine13 synthase
MLPELSARRAALEPPRVHAGARPAVPLRQEPEDFLVEEELGFAPAGEGTHQLLRVVKRDANTQWVARELARFAKCRPAEVGYAGLKDRRAVAVQWFSVPRPRAALTWQELSSEALAVLEVHAHHRKLPRGALAGNRFTVRLRVPDAAGLAAQLAPRLEVIGRDGVPNYFGPQRFGRDGANLRLGVTDPRTLAAGERGFVLSAARSALFNALLAARVSDASWARLEAGDVANLDGRGSVFAVPAPDAVLAERCLRLEIHPTGPMWGAGAPPSGARVRTLEEAAAAALPEPAALCVAAGMVQERRSLRLAVRELSAELQPDALVLRFRLGRGGFATAVLRELIDCAAQLAE